MAEREVIVSCYWNGRIEYGPDGVYYQGSTHKKISVKHNTQFSRLVHGLHIITGLHNFKIFGRYPVVVSPNLFRYIPLLVVSDSSLETMLEVPSVHPSINYVELYLEVQSTCDDVIHPAVKLEMDNELEVQGVDNINREANADFGNSSTHGGGDGEMTDKNSGSDGVAQAVNLTVDNANTNVSSFETSGNADSKRKKTESLTNEQPKSASKEKPVNGKDKTKEPPPSDNEEDMAKVGEELRQDREEEKEEGDGEEEKDDGKEEDEVDEERTVHESQSTGATESEAMDTEMQTEPIPPLEMWFPKSEYGTSMKFGTKCYVTKAVAKLESILEPDELEWFHEHPQFCHFFHMPKDKNHKMMGMWMLLLRMAKTQKCKEAWFVVNGVPIRYSLKEHALLSGLHCHEYPPDFTKFGNLKFVEKHFKREKATYEAVEKKFVSMRHSPDRLKMAILYFLSSVIIGKAKIGDGAPTVDEIFMRAVTDLEWCKTFPWGRLSFDDTMSEIFHMNGKLNGVVQTSWCFPSFIIPLELLAFEAIPVLMKNFREEVKGASSDCPRMCKTKFKSSSMKGFPLSEINDALGSTKDIQSIVEPTIDEVSLLSRIMDDINEEGDNSDVIIDGWKKCLMVENKKIWFEEFYNKDVDGRKEDKKVVAKQTVDLKDIMEAGFKQLGEKMTKMETKVNDKLENFEIRLKLVEKYVSPRKVDGGLEEVIGGENEVDTAEGESSRSKEKKNGEVKNKKRKI